MTFLPPSARGRHWTSCQGLELNKKDRGKIDGKCKIPILTRRELTKHKKNNDLGKYWDGLKEEFCALRNS